MARLAWSSVIGGPYGGLAADGAAGAWAKADPAESAKAQASASIRNIRKASLKHRRRRDTRAHNKVQNLKVEAAGRWPAISPPPL
jgi:hypothetical protein